MMMPTRCRHYRSGQVIDVDHVGEQILGLISCESDSTTDSLPWLGPGFFDMQINGAGGVSFNSGTLTTDDVVRAVREIGTHGVTGLLPTLVTNDQTALEHALRTLALAVESDEFVGRLVPGFHLEGPWISAEDGYSGAHPKEFVRPPNWDDFRRLQEAAGGKIKMVTLAPEWPGALDFIEQLHAAGVCIGLGHTAADDKTIEAAWYAGATVSTHLGNGVPELIHRHHNPIWGHLAWGWLTASVIMDGHHIPDAVFRAIFLAKSESRVALISDASSLAGLPPGRYRQWDHDVELTADGRLQVVGTPYLAGSVSFLDLCVAHAASALRSEYGLSMAIDMASCVPRQLLGLPMPTDDFDSPAGFIIYDWDHSESLRIHHMFCVPRHPRPMASHV